MRVYRRVEGVRGKLRAGRRRTFAALSVSVTVTLLSVLAGLPHLDRAVCRQLPDLLLSGKAETAPSFDRLRPDNELSQGKFLVASRQITDPRFMETVILLTRYDSLGTVGLVVNRPTEIQLSQVFPEIKVMQKDAHYLYSGGPVGIDQIQILIRSQGELEEARRIFSDVYVSSSRSMLERLVNDLRGKAKFRIYSGYAGWLPEQLEREIARGDWHVVRADAETVFEKAPSDIWPEFIRRTSVLHAKRERRTEKPGFLDIPI